MKKCAVPFMLDGEDGTYAVAVMCATELDYGQALEAMSTLSKQLEGLEIDIEEPIIH